MDVQRLRFLCWDTSTSNCVMATFGADAQGHDSASPVIYASKSYPYAMKHSEHLLEAFEELLAASKWTLRDVTHMGVGMGPGSFTGIRISALVAKIFMDQLRIPAVPICSLEPLLLPIARDHLLAGRESQPCRVDREACRGEIYSLEMNADEVASGVQPQPKLLAGSAPASALDPDCLVACVWAAFLSPGRMVHEPTELHPNYLRETDAERKKRLA